MSVEHPIVTVTGSSGAGTSFVKRAVEKIFEREKLNVAIVEGDSYHKYNRAEMKEKVAESKADGGPVLTHFSEKANEFGELEALFKEYKENGTGKRRYYIHSDEEADEHNARLGTNFSSGEFTPWEPIPEGTDILFYEACTAWSSVWTTARKKACTMSRNTLTWASVWHHPSTSNGCRKSTVTRPSVHTRLSKFATSF